MTCASRYGQARVQLQACNVQRATCVYNYAYNSTTRCHLPTVPPHSRLLLHGWSLSGRGSDHPCRLVPAQRNRHAC